MSIEISEVFLDDMAAPDCNIVMPTAISLTPKEQPLLWNDDLNDSLKFKGSIRVFADMPLYTQGFDWTDLKEAFDDESSLLKTNWRHYNSEAHSYYEGKYALESAFQSIKEKQPTAFNRSDRKIIIIRIGKVFSSKQNLFENAHFVIADFFPNCINPDVDCIIEYAIAEDEDLHGTTDLNVNIFSGRNL